MTDGATIEFRLKVPCEARNVQQKVKEIVEERRKEDGKPPKPNLNVTLTTNKNAPWMNGLKKAIVDKVHPNEKNWYTIWYNGRIKAVFSDSDEEDPSQEEAAPASANNQPSPSAEEVAPTAIELLAQDLWNGDLIAELPALSAKRLICHCRDFERCHGDSHHQGMHSSWLRIISTH